MNLDKSITSRGPFYVNYVSDEGDKIQIGPYDDYIDAEDLYLSLEGQSLTGLVITNVKMPEPKEMKG